MPKQPTTPSPFSGRAECVGFDLRSSCDLLGVPVQVPSETAPRVRVGSSEPISFAQRFATSGSFDGLFREGMSLVEEVADYLDGEGKIAARSLRPPVSVIYATESMRLTTRLLDVASWLVVQRAVRDRSMTTEEANAKRSRLKLRRLPTPASINQFDQLPAGLQSLIVRSCNLVDRLLRLDAAIRNGAKLSFEEANPVAGQLKRLEAAFRN